jgi:hypothetical protein
MAGFLCQISKKYSEEAPSIFAEIASKKVISIGARTRIDSTVTRHVWRQGQSAETTSQFAVEPPPHLAILELNSSHTQSKG